MNLLDLRAIAAVAKAHGVVTVCDNTFLSPYFQRPLELGIDLVVHSTTKYINGHSDVVGGAVVTGNAELAERIGYFQNALGTCQAPNDCFLVLRGIKTLALRMEAPQSQRRWRSPRGWNSTQRLRACCIPGLESHPQHDLALRQMTGFGGTFSFRVKGGQDAAFSVLGATHLFTLAESLGGRGIAHRAPLVDDPRLHARRRAPRLGHYRRPHPASPWVWNTSTISLRIWTRPSRKHRHRSRSRRRPSAKRGAPYSDADSMTPPATICSAAS